MEIIQNYALKSLNTFHINAYAQYFASFGSLNELEELLDFHNPDSAKMILGGGSNILFTQNYEGLILKNNIFGISIVNENEDFVFVKAGAGVVWHDFVLYCVNKNYGGIENLSLIPGNVGASPMQNIGAYGVEIKDIFYELEGYDLIEKGIQKFSKSDCEFGYRESVFKKKFKDRFAILNVTFRLRKQPVFNTSYGAIEYELNKMGVKELTVKAISDAVVAIRTSKLPDPDKLGNAGSFFKNPVLEVREFEVFNDLLTLNEWNCPYYKIDTGLYKIPAGWLIEQCGWKGYRSGDAGCYEHQALVIVNFGNATGNEIYNLSKEIIGSVKEKFGIVLEWEVNII